MKIRNNKASLHLPLFVIALPISKNLTDLINNLSCTVCSVNFTNKQFDYVWMRETFFFVSKCTYRGCIINKIHIWVKYSGLKRRRLFMFWLLRWAEGGRSFCSRFMATPFQRWTHSIWWWASEHSRWPKKTSASALSSFWTEFIHLLFYTYSLKKQRWTLKKLKEQ